jgi:hypothetical protein
MPSTCPKHRSAAATNGQERSVPAPAELHRQPSAGGPRVLPKLAVDPSGLQPGAALGPRTSGGSRTTPDSDGKPAAQVSNRSERSPRSRDHPDCLSHGGSQGFKSPSPPPTNPAGQSVAGSPSAALSSLPGPPRPHWGHGRPARAAQRRSPLGQPGAAVEDVQAVTERGVGLRIQVAVVEGSGRTLVACPTSSRKFPTNQPGARAGRGPRS